MKSLDPMRLRMALRASLACLLAMALTPWLPHIQPQWLLITIAILLTSESRLGALMQKTSGRLAGTVLGAVPALAIAYLSGGNANVAHYGMLLVVAVVSYWGVSLYETSPTATLAVVTTCMLLADPADTRGNALLRLYSIGVGAVLALLCAHVIFPIRSRWALRQAVLDCLTLQRDYTQTLVDQKDPLPEQGASILSNLMLQKRLIDEASKEARNFDSAYFTYVWERQRASFRYLQLLALTSAPGQLTPLKKVLKQFDQLIAEGGPIHGNNQEVPQLDAVKPLAPDAQTTNFCLSALEQTMEELSGPRPGLTPEKVLVPEGAKESE